MDNSIYVALSRQLALFRDLDTTANNIANVDTVGYTAEKMIFTDYLTDDGNRNDVAYTQDISSYRDTRAGKLKHTGSPLDVAISGPGYFQVQTAQGIRYTKAGNFTIDNNGTLVTHQGYPVLGNGGQPIAFNDTDDGITVGENGLLTVAPLVPGAPREARGEIGIVEFADEQELIRLDNQLFESPAPPLEPVESRVLQGVLERSNVEGVTEMVKLTKLSRSTSNTAKFIEVMYDLQRKTSNTYTQEQ